MAKLTFYPIGNADCCLIDLNNGKKILIDYAHCRSGEDEDDLRIDLYTELHNELDFANRDDIDVVTFTHADEDHVRKSSEFFEFDHAKKYQGDDRIKIKELWVPAGFLLETGLKNDAAVIQAEAKHRLIKDYGIRVFSRPALLEQWLKDNGLSLQNRGHLITDAGSLVPGFDREKDQVEFFIHSPFSFRVNDTIEDRNQGSLVLHATFKISGTETKVIWGADSNYEAWIDIVNITRRHRREERLEWDVFKIPHHSSYLALSDDKGKNVTTPKPEVKWLYEQGNSGGIIVSSSNPIPDEDTEQPPHKQAAKYYKQRKTDMTGKFEVTMEHPKPSRPEPLLIKIDKFGASLKMAIVTGASSISSRPAPRAGRG